MPSEAIANEQIRLVVQYGLKGLGFGIVQQHSTAFRSSSTSVTTHVGPEISEETRGTAARGQAVDPSFLEARTPREGAGIPFLFSSARRTRKERRNRKCTCQACRGAPLNVSPLPARHSSVFFTHPPSIALYRIVFLVFFFTRPPSIAAYRIVFLGFFHMSAFAFHSLLSPPEQRQSRSP